jgi:hypothetical protein
MFQFIPPGGGGGGPGDDGAGYGGSFEGDVTLATGEQTFTVPAGLAYVVGSRVRVVNNEDITQWVEGQVTAYSSTSMTIDADLVHGVTGDPWTPSEITPTHWWDAADAGTLSLSGADVTGWTDKGSGGGDASQSNAGKRPTYSAADSNFNSKPTVTNIAAGGLELATHAIPDAVSALMDSNTLNVGSVNSNSCAPPQSLLWCARWTPGADLGVSGMTFRRNGSDLGAAVYGGSSAPTGGAVFFAGRITGNGDGGVGRFFDPGGSGTLFNRRSDYARTGQLAVNVLIILTGSVSDDTLKLLEGWAAWRDGLEGSLPGDHPYKSAAPVIGAGDPITSTWNLSIAGEPGA